MTKRIITVIISLCLATGLLAVPVSTAQAATSGKCGEKVNWEIKGGGTATYELVISGTGPMYNYLKTGDCPWYDYTQTGFGYDIMRMVRKIIVKNGVTHIGNYAFAQCQTADALSLPDSVVSIGEGAFYGFRNVKDLVLPAALESIGYGAFWEAQFENVTFPSGLKTIEEAAFRASRINKVILPSSVKTVGAGAFAYCNDISEVALSSGIETIPDKLFFNCNGITSVNIPAGVKHIGEGAFESCNNLEKVSFPSGLLTIGVSAFESTKILNVNVPDSLVSIGQRAFSNTAWARKQPEGPVYIGRILYNYIGYCPEELYIRDDTVSITAGIFDEQNDLKYVEIPDGVVSVGSGAFANCFSLESAYIGASRIEDDAFAGSCLRSAFISDAVEYIGHKAFGGCYYLDKLVIITPEAVIEDNAFSDDSMTVYYDPGATFRRKNYGGTNITWKPLVPTSIEATGSKTEYLQHSQLNGYLIDIVGHFDDLDLMISPFAAQYSYDTSIPGPAQVTVTYGGVSDVFEINVTENAQIAAVFGSDNVFRAAGDDRYRTAFAAADKLRSVLGIEKFDTVIVASGDNFPDALAGSYLAVRKKAPILMLDKGGKRLGLLTDYIRENLVENGQIYILGGTGAVTEEADAALAQISPNVKRFAGANRYETNLMILEEAGITDGEELLIANALNFADALSASALGKPILLVNGSKGELRAEQADFVSSHSFEKMYILGGTSAVPESVKTGLLSAAPGVSIERLSGSTRYETSARIAEEFFENKPVMALATGVRFPDGLSGGPLAYAAGAPLVLVSERGYLPAVYYAAESGAEKFIIFGGTASVSEETADTVSGFVD